MPSFTSQGTNIRLFAEIQAAAENVLAALVFARKTLSTETKTILPFKCVNLPWMQSYFAFPALKHKILKGENKNKSNSTTSHWALRSQATDLHRALWLQAVKNHKIFAGTLQGETSPSYSQILKKKRHPKPLCSGSRPCRSPGRVTAAAWPLAAEELPALLAGGDRLASLIPNLSRILN